MKKLLTLLGVIGITGAAASTVVACKDKPTFTVLFVPSKDPGDLNSKTKKLGELIQTELAKNGFKEIVEVKTATDYAAAAGSVSSGTAAVAYLPTTAYYENSIVETAGKNQDSMHQLFQATRTGMVQEFIQAGNDSEKMNINGALTSIDNGPGNDSTNQFEIVKRYADKLDPKDIDAKDKEAGEAVYYRGQTYISKAKLHQYKQNILVGTVESLKAAYNKVLTKFSDNQSIFNDKNTDEDAYWTVLYNIFEQAAKDKLIGLSSEKSSGAGRVQPINLMIEAFLKSHPDKTLSDARIAITNLLQGNVQPIKSYAATAVQGVMDGRWVTGICFSDGRTQINDSDPKTVKKALEEVTVIGVTHGIVNDGAVYSVKYFDKKQDKNDKGQTELEAVQKSFIDLIQENPEAQTIFKTTYSHTGYKQNKLDDASMKAYEKTIVDAQISEINKLARDIAGTNL